jgi:four helix bundle protein
MEGAMKCYRDLVVWQHGIDLVAAVYKLSMSFPPAERYALCDQMHRAAVSIPANIAEGHARSSSKEFLHYLSISLGSLAELETHLTIAHRLAYLGDEQVGAIFNRTGVLGRSLRSLQKSMHNKVKQ